MVIVGYDVVVIFVKFLDFDLDVIVLVILDSGVKCYVVVGGVGSLIGFNGMKEFDDFNFLLFVKLNLVCGGYMFELLEKIDGLDWIYILLF